MRNAAILFLISVVSVYSQAQVSLRQGRVDDRFVWKSSFGDGLHQVWERRIDQPCADEPSDTFSLELSQITCELSCAYVQTFVAFGLNVKARIYDHFSLGVRLSLDAEVGTLFPIPYIGFEWENVGGFEFGGLIRPTVTEWIVPYWESWRVWIGDERRIALSASVLSNVPLNAVGYYDAGLGIAMSSSRDHRFWLGVTSLDKALGPGVKSQWEVGSYAFVTANASYMLGQKPGKAGFSLALGWKQEFH